MRTCVFQLFLSCYNKEYEESVYYDNISGESKVPRLPYENPDGILLQIEKDYFDNPGNRKNLVPGPFSDITADKVRLKVW